MSPRARIGEESLYGYRNRGVRWGILALIALAAALPLFIGARHSTADEPPDPIDPTSGQLNLLDLVERRPVLGQGP